MRTTRTMGLALLLVPLLLAGCGGDEGEELTAKAVERSFSRDVLPIFKKHCAACHDRDGQGYAASGFSVASYEDVMRGTKNGPVIQPGASYASTLQILIEHKADPDIAMPKIGRQLDDQEIQIIGEWIDQGARNN